MKTDRTSSESNVQKNVLRTKLAGTWYAADTKTLSAEIDDYLLDAGVKPLTNVIALILPHAGYRYSGITAAFGIKQIKDRNFKRVLIIGPTHQYPMTNVISVPNATHYETPLGEIPLDMEFIAKLKQHSFTITKPEVHQGEHSVQIEIPLIQRALKDFMIVPIVCGQLNHATTKKIASILHTLVDEETLVIVSSDFTHYGAHFGYIPFKKNIPENLKKLDMGAFRFVAAKDEDGFAKYVDNTGITVCGHNPIAILLAMLPDDAEAHLLHYDTSGNITGDFDNSVSYLSAAFTSKWTAAKQTDTAPPLNTFLSESDKLSLLTLARASLLYYMENGKKATPIDLGIEITAGMSQTLGAFVTLHKNGELRGCIGEIIPRRELYKAVMEHAINSALNDHRFPPVKKEEVTQLEFEISALSPPKAVASHRDIVIDKHGVVLQKGHHSAVFLPQVASEQGWGVEETLTHLAMKAGLGPNDWRQGTEFLVFEAIVFSEKNPQ